MHIISKQSGANAYYYHATVSTCLLLQSEHYYINDRWQMSIITKKPRVNVYYYHKRSTNKLCSLSKCILLSKTFNKCIILADKVQQL